MNNCACGIVSKETEPDKRNLIMNEKDRKKLQRDDARQQYPGVAVNEADDGKVDKELVKERTRTLNNNPRNDQ